MKQNNHPITKTTNKTKDKTSDNGLDIKRKSMRLQQLNFHPIDLHQNLSPRRSRHSSTERDREKNDRNSRSRSHSGERRRKYDRHRSDRGRTRERRDGEI